MKRVVVTGLGTINPLGHNVEDTWRKLINGESAATKVSHFNAEKFRSQVACEVKNFDPKHYFDKSDLKRTDLFTQYAIVAADQAIEDSQINTAGIDPFDIGVIWGTGQGGMQTFENEVENYITGEYTPRFNPFFIPKLLVNMASGLISMKYGYQGINYTPVSACATGNTAIMDAYNYIKFGKAKAFITGGSEAGITPASFGGFAALKAMSARNHEPQKASRPFDIERDGFVMGEGAAALVLEEYEHAKNRGAKIYAEIVGASMTADAHHITTPHPEGIGASKAIERALEEAQLQPEEVDYLNLHATSTQIGDLAELNAVHKVFKNTKNLHLSSTKSMTGHLLGAAAAIEAIFAIKAINDNIVPPTINVENLDPKIPEGMNIVINQSLQKEVKVAMSNAFGFGGHNSTVVFKEI